MSKKVFKSVDSFQEAFFKLADEGLTIRSVDEDGDVCDTYTTLSELSGIISEEIYEYDWQVEVEQQVVQMWSAVHEFIEYGTPFTIYGTDGLLLKRIETIEDLKSLENPVFEIIQD